MAQIRAITFARIMVLLRNTEEQEAPNKLTLRLKSDSSGSIVDAHNIPIKEWGNVNELNELIKDVTEKFPRNRTAGYYGR